MPKEKDKQASPKVLVVLNGKGGVGKTTTAVNLAAIFAEDRRVLLLDSDVQRSATWWLERVHQAFDFSHETDINALRQLKALTDYELIVVDTPPALHSESLGVVLALADYLLLPTPPAPMDVTALINTVKKLVKPSGVFHRVLLTKVDSRSLKEAQEAQTMLEKLDISAFQTYIRTYKAHERAAMEGCAISQWKGPNAQEAQADYYRVAAEVLRDWKRL
ncbi:ParA family protein [Leptothoe kymatousa]|uniref:ParA family protein n=1 Tax=Leptothoe kymatousa TAU-MAC 1615 TaxID=2364775 RepID=A0ABS5Y7G5_9CYAN|nr:AAA family ATPase [Leptothoe kymatousa]MBT9313438.1 ParA family protein [Leptothoe kymatousa TAU-MAC 1615]